MLQNLAQIKNDDEAMAILSALGFSRADWPFINKVGGPSLVLHSDLIAQRIKHLSLALVTWREKFDRFYENGGFLISSRSQPKSRLFRSAQAPLVFYGYYPQTWLTTKKAIAIVGSRQASRQALDLTKKLSFTLAHRGLVVISGGAYGIDQAAHAGALAGGGNTVMVPGKACPLRKDSQIEGLAKDAKGNFTVIYPFGPFLPQGKYMFVERNRYVASLADALVIVQGKAGSGTLHTAKFASALKVPIFAVPGSVHDDLSFVPNQLLAAGMAEPLVDFNQFAEAFVTKADRATKSDKIEPKESMAKPKLKDDLPYLLQVLSDHENSLEFDELLRITGWSLAKLQRELLDYELTGQIGKRGAQFVLTGN